MIDPPGIDSYDDFLDHQYDDLVQQFIRDLQSKTPIEVFVFVRSHSDMDFDSALGGHHHKLLCDMQWIYDMTPQVGWSKLLRAIEIDIGLGKYRDPASSNEVEA